MHLIALCCPDLFKWVPHEHSQYKSELVTQRVDTHIRKIAKQTQKIPVAECKIKRTHGSQHQGNTETYEVSGHPVRNTHTNGGQCIGHERGCHDSTGDQRAIDHTLHVHPPDYHEINIQAQLQCQLKQAEAYKMPGALLRPDVDQRYLDEGLQQKRPGKESDKLCVGVVAEQ